MANRYWVGTTQDWHTAANWSLTSGGAGGAGVPTSTDDVFIDGNGFVLCWASTPFVCNNFTILVGATELNIFDQGGIIHGDFEMQDGYFGPTGGGGYTVEFKGNWLNTGGNFSVGTGTGVDPTCEFSGIGKTYNLNQLSAASFQNVLVSGEVTFSGTRLGVMNISQRLSITGMMTVNANGTLICDVDISGVNGGFDVLTGTLTGTGRLWFRYRSTSTMTAGGTISIRYFRFVIQDALAVLPPRTWASPCEVEIEYTDDAQTFQLGDAGRHYFMNKLTLLCDVAPPSQHTAVFDCDTNNAEMWVHGIFNIHKNAFPAHLVTIKFGDGTHVFRGSIDFYFSYASGSSTELVVDPGEGTLILWPRGRKLILP